MANASGMEKEGTGFLEFFSFLESVGKELNQEFPRVTYVVPDYYCATGDHDPRAEMHGDYTEWHGKFVKWELSDCDRWDELHADARRALLEMRDTLDESKNKAATDLVEQLRAGIAKVRIATEARNEFQRPVIPAAEIGEEDEEDAYVESWYYDPFLQGINIPAVGGFVDAHRGIEELLHELKTAFAKNMNELFLAGQTDLKSGDVVNDLRTLSDKCKHYELSNVYRDDLLKSLEEIRLCYPLGCYIAVMCLAGKVLEICLKQKLNDLEVDFDDEWMVGKLFSTLKKSPGDYVDPGLNNIGNIINKSRIPAVHSKESIPVPSREEAMMVIYAMSGLVARTLVDVPVEPDREELG